LLEEAVVPFAEESVESIEAAEDGQGMDEEGCLQ
jgi:hypothetical protein